MCQSAKGATTSNQVKAAWKATKGVQLHQDNAPADKSLVAKSAVHDRGFELIDHPLYSPDLAPSDYFLLPNLKKHLAGKRCKSDDAFISAVEDFFEGKEENFLKCEITYPA